MLPFIKLNEIESEILKSDKEPKPIIKQEEVIQEKPIEKEEVIDLSLPDEIEKKPIVVKKPFTLFPKDDNIDYGKMLFDVGKYVAPIIFGLKVL